MKHYFIRVKNSSNQLNHSNLPPSSAPPPLSILLPTLLLPPLLLLLLSLTPFSSPFSSSSSSSSSSNQNEEQMSLTSPVDSQFFRMLLEEEGPEMRDFLDAEEYLVPQPNMFPRTQGDGLSTAGHSRHHSYRVSGHDITTSPTGSVGP